MDRVSRGDVSADVSMLAFPDPANFCSRSVALPSTEWKSIAASSSPPLSQDVLGWLVNKVQVQIVFQAL